MPTVIQVVIPKTPATNVNTRTSFKRLLNARTEPSEELAHVLSLPSLDVSLGQGQGSAWIYSWVMGLGLRELQSRSRDQPLPLTILLPSFWVYPNFLPHFFMFPGLIHRFAYGFPRNSNINSKGSWGQPLVQKFCLAYLLVEPSSNLSNVPLSLHTYVHACYWVKKRERERKTKRSNILEIHKWQNHNEEQGNDSHKDRIRLLLLGEGVEGEHF